jgi:hypothetical protein
MSLCISGAAAAKKLGHSGLKSTAAGNLLKIWLKILRH